MLIIVIWLKVEGSKLKVEGLKFLITQSPHHLITSP
jgi:hypothetical protein